MCTHKKIYQISKYGIICLRKMCNHMIERKKYLDLLIKSKNNGFPKVITGIRRCGKSFLLENIYRDYLISIGVPEENVLLLRLDDVQNASLRNPLKLTKRILDWSINKNDCYVFIDEIQRVYSIMNPELTSGKIIKATKEADQDDIISFVDVVLGISNSKNIDLYITGSNSKMLSSDIVTQFRDKATNIAMQPLSFEEFYEYAGLSVNDAVNEYMQYGGMPLAILKSREDKKEYLSNLYTTTYFRDIIEHNTLKRSSSLDELANILSENIGTLVNSEKIANTFRSVKHEQISALTVEKYIDFFIDAFILREARRFDVKGRHEIGAGRKYYFSDLGLRNARVNFSVFDEGQLLENFIYNELTYNGYSVNVGIFESFEKNKENTSVRKNNEIDFYAVKDSRKLYIQSCSDIRNRETYEREIRPYTLLNDQIQKVIVVKDNIELYQDKNGITFIGVADFILKFIK